MRDKTGENMKEKRRKGGKKRKEEERKRFGFLTRHLEDWRRR